MRHTYFTTHPAQKSRESDHLRDYRRYKVRIWPFFCRICNAQADSCRALTCISDNVLPTGPSTKYWPRANASFDSFGLPWDQIQLTVPSLPVNPVNGAKDRCKSRLQVFRPGKAEQFQSTTGCFRPKSVFAFPCRAEIGLFLSIRVDGFVNLDCAVVDSQWLSLRVQAQ